MSKIKNSWLDQYGARPFEQQQFGTAGVKGVNDYSIVHCVLSELRCNDELGSQVDSETSTTPAEMTSKHSCAASSRQSAVDVTL